MASYTIDTSHSEITFSVRHMVFSKVRGQFKKWSATLAFDEAAPTKSQVAVEIDAASIDTRDEKRDGHLSSPDFFDVGQYPKLTFKSTKIEAGAKNEYKVTGALTMHGVTHDVTLDAHETGRGKDPWGNGRIGFSGKTSINRGDWGLKWNQALETGGVLVSEKVDIEFEVEVIQGK